MRTGQGRAHEEQFERRDFGAAFLEAADHLADESALHAFRFDEQQRALHLRLLERTARVHVAALRRRATEAHPVLCDWIAVLRVESCRDSDTTSIH